MNNLEGIKVGDRVWSPLGGWGIVDKCDPNRADLAIRVRFDNGSFGSFYADGRFYPNGIQCLFWDEVKIDPPPRPKKIVKKEITGFVSGSMEQSYHSCTFFTRRSVTATCPAILMWEEEE